jgi:hypothetical protein
LAGARWGESRLFKALPEVSAVVVISLGLWLCYNVVHTRMASAGTAAHAHP